MAQRADIAIIGGTGVYDSGLITNAERVSVYTPYGAPSAKITVGEYAGHKVAFLPRHGEDHTIPPHKIPFRANIWALKELGVSRIIAPCAVGSLRPEIKPEELVFPDQFIDLTKHREVSFHDGGVVCHMAMSEPFCGELREIAIATAKESQIAHHGTGTQICIEGPRFSTKAESIYYRDAMKADTINMTFAQECILAREKEICYMSVAMVTDYDAWSDEPVDNAMVLRTMKNNVKTIKYFLLELLPKIPLERAKCVCHNALEGAFM